MSWIWIKDYRLGINSNINESMMGLPYSDNDKKIEYKVEFDGVADTIEDVDAFARFAKDLIADGVTPVIAIFTPRGRHKRKTKKQEGENVGT